LSIDALLSIPYFIEDNTIVIIPTLYQERTEFGKMKMDPSKRAQTQNAGEVPSLQWFFSQSVERFGLICCWQNTFTTDTLRSRLPPPPPPQHKRYSSVHARRFDLTSPDY
jgi:hypothetical protein